jgi:hypothetical protein
MENKELIMNQMEEVDSKMNHIVDEMIERYGKFVTLKDNNSDKYLVDLVSSYNKLAQEKEFLAASLDIID